MDLIAFRSTRALRRAEPASDQTLPVADAFSGQRGEDGPLLMALRDLLAAPADPPPAESHPNPGELIESEGQPAPRDLRDVGRRRSRPAVQVPQLARAAAQTYVDSPAAVTQDDLDALYPVGPVATASGAPPVEPGDEPTVVMTLGEDGQLTAAETVPGDRVLQALAALDRALARADNRPEPAEFETMLETLQRTAAGSPGKPGWFERWAMSAWARLVDSLMAALLLPGDGIWASRLTRLLLVAGLVRRRMERAAAFDSAEEIFQLLRHRTILLPGDVFPAVLPNRGVSLVRTATVSDLFVVRSEWRCYVAGEIAEIRNVMAHETLNHRTLQIDEREVLAEKEEERTTSEEQSREETTKSDVASEAQREMNLAIHADGQVNVSAQYSSVKVDAHVGASADYSLHDATRRATQLGHEVVARAVSKVESRVRSSRQERTLTRYEEASDHGFTNTTAEHSRGVYRWVDRIDRYQIFRYPDRLHLEFQLPEPGKFLRDQLSSTNVPTAVGKPPPFNVRASEINPANFDQLMLTYRAAGAPPPPAPNKAVSMTVSAEPKELPKTNEVPMNAPTATKTENLALPPGYRAVTVTMSGHAVPILARWWREWPDSLKFDNYDGFHSLDVTLAVGDKRWTRTHGGTFTGAVNSVQTNADATMNQGFLDSDLEFSEQGVAMPPLVDKVPVTVSASGASIVTAVVEISCEPTAEAIQDWQQQVYDAVLTAHQTWERNYQAELARLNLSAAVQERSPARNAELIRDELKRNVIAWLLDESPFQGRAALLDGSYDVNLPRAREVADEVQFLEQALEWINLSYVAYPYYWAARDNWDDLMDLETVDPDLGRFLRAGSARVVVPARPDLTEAVTHWLLYRQPWLGGPPPVPGEHGYLSVAAEIRDLTQPPPDGEPGESWEARLPTTLRWLDPDPDLPSNPLARLGKPPHEPADPLSPTP
jgi:hypothetical protein